MRANVATEPSNLVAILAAVDFRRNQRLACLETVSENLARARTEANQAFLCLWTVLMPYLPTTVTRTSQHESENAPRLRFPNALDQEGKDSGAKAPKTPVRGLARSDISRRRSAFYRGGAGTVGTTPRLMIGPSACASRQNASPIQSIDELTAKPSRSWVST
jgi:hypothetical protein